MLINASILIDFGNSETRVALLSGAKKYRFNLPNHFSLLPPGYNVNNKYQNDKSTIFLWNNTYWANGLIVEREFKNQAIRPSGLQSKTVQETTDLTLQLAIIKSYVILSQVNQVPVDQLDATFDFSVLLPPLDHEINDKAMENKIAALNTITSFMPLPFTKSFKIGNIQIHSEAISAFFGAFYDEDNLQPQTSNAGKDISKGDFITYDNRPELELVEVPSNSQFAEGYVLILDIGAGTTDVAIFKDLELIESSKETFKQGGNTVNSYVQKKVRMLYDFKPDNIQECVSTCNLYEGSVVHDISSIVTEAKESYASAVTADILTYLENANVELRLVKGLLVTGGGALPSIRTVDVEGQPTNVIASPAMSTVLEAFLRQHAPNMKALDTSGKDLRYLNIDGLTILHKYA